jgi:hypothetical protein
MVGRTILKLVFTLVLLLAPVVLFAIFGKEIAIGIIIITSIAFALIFVGSAELVVGIIPTVRRINSLKETWGDYNLDPGKLANLHTQWNAEKAADAEATLEPTRIRNFCTIQLERLIRIAGTMNGRERSRRISDIIRVVSYPESRLAHITHELRLYALLLALTFLYALIKKAPQILTKLFSADFLEGCRLIGENPIEFLSGLELAIFAVFATRLLGEMSNLRQYTK